MEIGKIVILCITLIIVVSVAVFALITSNRIKKMKSMTFNEMLDYTTKDNPDAVIAVGYIKNGEIIYTFYGENSTQLQNKEYEYEIGSITKTITCSLLCKLISQNEINLDDSIDKYIDLVDKEYYPTINRLVTHTAGYKGYYINKKMVSNILKFGGNFYYGINNEMLNEQIEEAALENKTYTFKYSNFGMSVVGEVIAQYIGDDYTTVMSDYLSSELKLNNTRISEGTGNLDGYWKWENDDAYIPVGAVISTMEDMMKYLSLHMTDEIPYLAYGHEIIEQVDATKDLYDKLGIRMDAMGIGWIIDAKNNIVWHDGGTSKFNAYIGFDKINQVGVVILSNLSPLYRVPASVMGAKLITDLQNENN